MYKQKIEAYDKLINKLTLQLEKNITKNNKHQNMARHTTGKISKLNT